MFIKFISIIYMYTRRTRREHMKRIINIYLNLFIIYQKEARGKGFNSEVKQTYELINNQ